MGERDMRKMSYLVYLGVISVFCISYPFSSSSAVKYPFVRLMPTSQDKEGEIEPTTLDSPRYPLYFYRYLGLGKNQILDKVNASLLKNDAVSYTSQSVSGYELVEVNAGSKASFGYFGGKAIYFLNSKNVGYCILEQKPYFTDRTAPEYFGAIKALTFNDSYLASGLNIPAGVQISFYEKVAGDMVERYGIATMSGRELLVLDAFYPLQLESQVKPTIIQVLNQSLAFNPYL